VSHDTAHGVIVIDIVLHDSNIEYSDTPKQKSVHSHNCAFDNRKCCSDVQVILLILFVDKTWVL